MTEPSYARRQQYSPHRPLDWRWQRAQHLVETNARLLSRRDDELTLRAARYLRAVASCRTGRQADKLMAQAEDEQFVQVDDKARQELIAAQTQLQERLQSERGSLDRQHEVLEAERKQIAAQRHRDPIVAAAIMHVGILLACLLPLVVCVCLIRTLKETEPDGELCQLLVEELVALEPMFLVLPAPPVQPESLPELRSDEPT